MLIIVVCVSFPLGGVDFSALAQLTSRAGLFLVRDCPGLCLLSTSTPTLHPVQAHRPWNGGFLSSSGPGGRPLRRWGRVWEEGADLVPGGDLVVSLEVLMVLGRTWVLSSLPRARESVCLSSSCWCSTPLLEQEDRGWQSLCHLFRDHSPRSGDAGTRHC